MSGGTGRRQLAGGPQTTPNARRPSLLLHAASAAILVEQKISLAAISIVAWVRQAEDKHHVAWRAA